VVDSPVEVEGVVVGVCDVELGRVVEDEEDSVTKRLPP
jgi:hypothetical protein